MEGDGNDDKKLNAKFRKNRFWKKDRSSENQSGDRIKRGEQEKVKKKTFFLLKKKFYLKDCLS